MPRFPKSLAAWQSNDFARALKDEIEAMEAGALPLDEGTAHGGFVDDADITAVPFTSTDDEDSVIADVGIFFSEIIAGCSCGDEPETVDVYCRLRIRIDKASAEAEVSVVLD
jgi:hypothetical protein